MSVNCLLISPDFPPPFVGGSLVYVHSLIVNPIPNVNFDVLTARLRNDEKELSLPCGINRSPYLISSDNPSTIQLIRMYLYLLLYLLIVHRRYQIIFLNISAVGNGFFAFCLKILKKKSVIISFAEELTLAMASKGVKGIIKRLFLKRYNDATFFICICDFAKEFLIRQGVKQEQIVVIPSPLHKDKWFSGEDSCRKHSNDFQILSVGRLIKRKGFHLLIQAFEKVLNSSVIPVKLIIVGDGPEKQTLECLIKQLKLDENVILFGKASDQELSRLYAESSLFVLANIMLANGDCEGSPLVFIEASASGMPVIGGLEGGASTAIEDGITGYLVDPSDIDILSNKILYFLNNPDITKKMGKMGKEKVFNMHSPEKIRAQFAALVHSLILPVR